MLFLSAFLGAGLGQVVGGVLVWRYYLQPRMRRASRVARATTRPAPSQTATTPGFVPTENPVTVSRVGFGRIKRISR